MGMAPYVVKGGNWPIMAGTNHHSFVTFWSYDPYILGKQKDGQELFVYVEYERIIFTVLEMKIYKIKLN